MKQRGRVVEVTENRVKVRVMRESACGGNCVSCKGCPTEAIIVECLAADSVSVGDEVTVTMPTSEFFKGMLIGYGQMILLMIAGAVLGYKIFLNEIASIIGMVGGLVLGMIISKIFSKYKKYNMTAEKADK